MSSKTLVTYLVLYSKLARLQISCISSIVSVANIKLVFVCVHVFVLTCVFCFRLRMLILGSFLREWVAFKFSVYAALNFGECESVSTVC